MCAVYLRRKRIADLCKFTADVTAKASFCELKMANVLGLDSGISLWLLEPHLSIHSCQAHA